MNNKHLSSLNMSSSEWVSCVDLIPVVLFCPYCLWNIFLIISHNEIVNEMHWKLHLETFNNIVLLHLFLNISSVYFFLLRFCQFFCENLLKTLIECLVFRKGLFVIWNMDVKYLWACCSFLTCTALFIRATFLMFMYTNPYFVMIVNIKIVRQITISDYYGMLNVAIPNMHCFLFELIIDETIYFS